MKNIVLLVTTIMVSILTFAIIMTNDGRMVRQAELDDTLSSAVEESIQNIMQSTNYEISEYDAFIADLVETMVVPFNSDSDIVVKVMKVDMEKGMLSIRVEANYKHINGNDGKVSCDKTVIFDKLVIEVPNTYLITFYQTKDDMDNNADYYKQYTVGDGEIINVPKAPEIEEKTFICWCNEDGSTADFTQPVSGEKKYYAKWN